VQINRPASFQPSVPTPPGLIPKPSPRRGRPQDAKPVHFPRVSVGVVDNPAHSLDDPGGRRGSPKRVNGPGRRPHQPVASDPCSALTCQLAITRGARLTRRTCLQAVSNPEMG
jgi:hypothetical protein